MPLNTDVSVSNRAALYQDFNDSPVGRFGERSVSSQPPDRPRAADAGASRQPVNWGALRDRVISALTSPISPLIRTDPGVRHALRETSSKVGDLLGALSAVSADGSNTQTVQKLFDSLPGTAFEVVKAGGSSTIEGTINARADIHLKNMSTEQLRDLEEGLKNASQFGESVAPVGVAKFCLDHIIVSLNKELATRGEAPNEPHGELANPRSMAIDRSPHQAINDTTAAGRLATAMAMIKEFSAHGTISSAKPNYPDSFLPDLDDDDRVLAETSDKIDSKEQILDALTALAQADKKALAKAIESMQKGDLQALLTAINSAGKQPGLTQLKEIVESQLSDDELPDLLPEGGVQQSAAELEGNIIRDRAPVGGHVAADAQPTAATPGSAAAVEHQAAAEVLSPPNPSPAFVTMHTRILFEARDAGKAAALPSAIASQSEITNNEKQELLALLRSESLDQIRIDRVASGKVDLTLRLAALGLVPKAVPNDGHCMFHAIADQMPQFQTAQAGQSALRFELLDRLENLTPTEQGFVAKETNEASISMKIEDARLSIQKGLFSPELSDSSIWGTDSHARVLALMTNRPVLIMSIDGDQVFDPAEMEGAEGQILSEQDKQTLLQDRQPIVLVHSGQNHWESIQPGSPAAAI